MAVRIGSVLMNNKYVLKNYLRTKAVQRIPKMFKLFIPHVIKALPVESKSVYS